MTGGESAGASARQAAAGTRGAPGLPELSATAPSLPPAVPGLCDILAELPDQPSVLLHGSAARGSRDRHSDWNLLVLSDAPARGQEFLLPPGVEDAFLHLPSTGVAARDFPAARVFPGILKAGPGTAPPRVTLLFQPVRALEDHLSGFCSRGTSDLARPTVCWGVLQGAPSLQDSCGRIHALRDRFPAGDFAPSLGIWAASRHALMGSGPGGLRSAMTVAAARKDWLGLQGLVRDFADAWFEAVFATLGRARPEGSGATELLTRGNLSGCPGLPGYSELPRDWESDLDQLLCRDMRDPGETALIAATLHRNLDQWMRRVTGQFSTPC